MPDDEATTVPTQLERLSEPFPPEMLKRHPSKGLTYVPIPEVIARLNRILKPGNWNSKIVQTWTAGTVETSTGTYPKWAMAQVELYGEVDGNNFSFHGVGGQEIQFTGKPDLKGPVDIGDSYKGAVSDATKKAAQSLGVGLELAREDDALHYERALRDVDQPKANPGSVERLKSLAAKLQEGSDERREFVRWWAELTGDGERGKKFDSGQVTVREAAEGIEYLAVLVPEDESDPKPVVS